MSFTYTPDPGFTGRDWFTWQVDDESMHGDYASAFIDVQPTPQPAVTLTVGNYNDPALPGLKQDTPFVPVDDGYQSDDQSTPDDQLPEPPTGDPELVPASVNLSVPDGQYATWTLTFGDANLRVFMVDPNSAELTQVTNGQQFTYSPGSSPTDYSFEVQGLSEAAGVPITAMLTPGGTSQPAQANVNVNVGKPLQVLSVNDNQPGTVLTADQQHAGVFVPISNITNKAKDPVAGIAYQLPIVIHGLSGPATLKVPQNWIVVDANGKAGPAGKALPLQPNADGSDIKLFVEATDGGGSNPEITLTPVGQPGKAQRLGTVAVTPFVLSYFAQSAPTGVGPVDVPQFGTYEYNIKTSKVNSKSTAVTNGKWLAPVNNATPPKGVNTNDMTVTWAAGPNVGKAIYEVDAQFIWDMAVNIYQIAVSTPAGQKAAQAGTVIGTINGTVLTVASQGLIMRASVTVTPPAAAQGIKHLNIGFVQNLTPKTTTGTYQIPGPPPVSQTDTVFAPDINSVLDNNTFWDTQNPAYNASLKDNRKFYSISAHTQISGQDLSASPTVPISTEDAPRITIPINGPVGKALANIVADTLLWNFTMYVAAITDEVPATSPTYVPEAYMPWTFDGSGSVAPDPKTGRRAWTLTGKGVQFPPDSNNPAWIAAMPNTSPPKVDGKQFNSVVQDPANPIRVV